MEGEKKILKLKKYNDEPYRLDILVDDRDGKMELPALTRKNAGFIEAVVHLDSNYGRDLDKRSVPEFEVKDDTNPSNLDGKYSGSTAYWFD